MPEELHQVEENQARDHVNAWVARFAPLVMTIEPLDERTTKDRLKLAERLSQELDEVTLSSTKLDAVNDHELLSTFRMARSQISSLENDLRIRLGKLSPGDPESRADLNDLQNRLAETAAKIEMGVKTDVAVPEVLDIITAPPNLGAAGGLLLFGIGWNAFTFIHATFMIGAMWMAMGPVALFLLAFYAIFFGVGFAMLAGAYLAAAQERILFEGNTLVVQRTLGPIKTRKEHVIDLKSEAYIGKVDSNIKVNNKAIRGRGIILTKEDGSPLHLAFQTTESKRKEYLKQINAYMEAQAA